jgi:geranylgeranylglycerol-phosphate geranylgeranyltransferase
LNFLITFLSIYFAIVIADKSLFLSWKAFLGSLAGGIISGAGMVINDYFDVEIDRINRPERPIPAGLISSNTAIVYYVILNLIALALLLFTNSIALLIALISIVVIFFYSHSLKNRGLIGNFVVGFMTGLAFIFGGVIGENVLPMLFPFLFALLVNFAREILKDVEDIEGDRIKNLKTFPIVYGEKRAIQFFVFLISLTIIVTIIPFLLGVFNVYYLLIVLFLVDLVFVHIIKRVLNQPSRTELRKLSELIKYEMIFGLIAIYIGVN